MKLLRIVAASFTLFVGGTVLAQESDSGAHDAFEERAEPPSEAPALPDETGEANQQGNNEDGQANQEGENEVGQANQQGNNEDGQANQGGQNEAGQVNQEGDNQQDGQN